MGVPAAGVVAHAWLTWWIVVARSCGNYCDGEYNGQDLRFPYPGFPVGDPHSARVPHTESARVVSSEWWLCGWCQVAPGIKFDWNTFSEVEGAVNVRGCAYEHTAKRELLMAGLVDDALRPLNFNCGLIPAALWTYNIPEAPFPLVRCRPAPPPRRSRSQA